MNFIKKFLGSLTLLIGTGFFITLNVYSHPLATEKKPICNAGLSILKEKGWLKINARKLSELICQYGKNSPSYNPNQKPVAAFDWDNTVMKNDIGEATLYWLISHGKLKRSVRLQEINPWLSTSALKEITRNCSGKKAFFPTRTQPKCADTILAIYHDKPLENHKSAWKNIAHPERIFPPYFFYAQLFSGYTPQEIAAFTEKALQFNLNNKIGAMQKIGSHNYPAYVRIYEPMKELITRLQEQGFAVWIISASLQASVEVAAQRVSINKNHVIGLRQTLDHKGRLLPRFQGCGIYPNGNDEIISYKLGKRCWLNKEVFKVTDPNKMMLPAPIIFAAGDSEGDLIFLKDALGLRLVLNRNKIELFCHAYANSDGKWLLNPMFIKPLKLHLSPAECRLSLGTHRKWDANSMLL